MSHVIDLTWLRQFYIIIHLEVDSLLIIYYLIYLNFLVKLLNEPLESTFEITYAINLFN